MTAKRTRDAEKRGMQMVGLELPRDIVTALDHLKLRRGKSRNRLVVDILTAYLKRSTINVSPLDESPTDARQSA